MKPNEDSPKSPESKTRSKPSHKAAHPASRVRSLHPAQLDQLAINTIRFLSVDAVEKANSGHPGLPMGAAPMAYVLWTRFLKHNPTNPHWFNRDRFVLSAGHGSMLLYSCCISRAMICRWNKSNNFANGAVSLRDTRSAD